jgi:hypothetical protein
VCVCVCVCLSLSLSFSLSLFLSSSLPLSLMCLFVCLSVCVFVCVQDVEPNFYTQYPIQDYYTLLWGFTRLLRLQFIPKFS